MLEHQKIVLKNLSENKRLFKKELIKSMSWLDSDELKHLRKWVKEEFWGKHSEIINEVFRAEYGLS